MEIYDGLKLALDSEDGYIIGRNGSTELTCLLNPSVTPQHLKMLEIASGIFPMPHETLYNEWKKDTIEANKAADLLVAGWYAPLKQKELEAYKAWNVTATFLPLRSLEPYYQEPGKQWTEHLRGQDVAVVSSFTKTASQQIKKGAKAIWKDHGVLFDDIKWHWIQTGHPPSIAGGRNEWSDHISSWKDAVNHVVSEVVKTSARIVLIGCGALSMPIAKMLKDRGHIVIIMGGAIQVLFGIKGARWKTHSVISSFWNDEWVWCLKEEIPRNASLVEGACYWNTEQ